MAADARPLIHWLGSPASVESACAALPAPLPDWFRRRFGNPSAAQRLAWPALAAGDNLLLSAPTGSGKTLAAFLPILAALMESACETASGGVRCLYVAPLKSLINDVRKNLRRTLREIAEAQTEQGIPTVRLRVGRRTGDTDERVRRLLRRQPPDILLTTPESLAVLLAQPTAETLFADLRWLVIDEVHALATGKRGADLALSLERLTALARTPPQRIGLSATCTPLPVAAEYLAGVGRPCAIAAVRETNPLELRVEPLAAFGSGFLKTLLDRLERELETNRTLLIFTNVRSLAERVTWGLRRRLPDLADQIAVHHSSLSAPLRRRVERRLKRGQLRVAVSSTSLELGIDIGSVDGVVLVHPPGGVVRLLQRVGRAGHAPRKVRRGLVLTASPAELLEAVATTACGFAGQLEPLRVPDAPLDVLCQQLLGMAASRPWTRDEAFALVRQAYPYRQLPRADFDDCLAYLSGRDRADHDWLPARLAWFDDQFTIADERTARLLLRNLGTIIAEEEPRPVVLTTERRNDSGWPPSETNHDITIGSVDEQFVERLNPGDRFLLDGRCLEFRGVEGRAVVVAETVGYPGAPRWQGGGVSLSPDLAERLYLLRCRAAEALREGPAELLRLLREEYQLDGPGAEMLLELFQLQECVSELPEPAGCLVESVSGPLGTDYFLHTPLNRAGNDALARVAVLRLVREHGLSAASMSADLGIQLTVRADLHPDDFRAVLAAEGFDADLTTAVAGSWALKERFHQVALTGLMLLRNPLGPRRRVGGHDWAERRLFEQVQAADPEFVLIRQARRELYESTLDASAARRFAEELPRRIVRCRRLRAVSPLAEAWTQPAVAAVESPDTPAQALQRLHAELMGASPAF
ncbi:MAG: DEAD/DEAH box helicase [Planctomycetia bacterium]|nr:DEAD/DEAH box helicase [Planctomycetia bacterium]